MSCNMTETNYKPTRNKNLDSRVGRLEGVVQSLSQEVQDVTKAVRDITASLSTFKEDVLARLGMATAPKWPLITAVGSMLLTIFGLCGTIIAILLSGQSGAIQDNHQILNQHQERFTQLAHEQGVSSAWKEVFTTRIESLDKTLSNKILSSNENTQNQINELRRTLEVINAWKLIHQSDSNYKFGRLDTLTDNCKQQCQTDNNLKQISAMLNIFMDRLEGVIHNDDIRPTQ